MYLIQGYDVVLRREWWRRARERIGSEAAAEVGAPLEHNSRGLPRSLDEITSIDLLPPFDTVAAPPVGSGPV